MNKTRISVILFIIILLTGFLTSLIPSTRNLNIGFYFIFIILMAIFNGNDNAILRSNKNLDERQLNDKIKTLSASYRITEIITYTLLIIVFIYSVTSTISGIFISTSDNFGILDSTWITNGILIPVYSLIWLVVGIIEIPIFVFKWNKNPVKED